MILLTLMATLTLQPIAAAVLHHSEKTPVGSALRTREWAEVPLALRNRAQFSAGVESARVLNRIQGGIASILGHLKESGGVIADRSKLIRDLGRLAEAEGIRPADPAARGTVRDIGSEARAALIYEQQTGQAYGFADWKGAQDADALDAAPAQELVRIRDSRVKRDWITRWRQAGGRVFPGASPGGQLQDGIDGRCIALKTDPVWAAISRFGNPWPPYDFNSGVWVEDVDRAEAVELGMIQASQQVQPAEVDFNRGLQASVRDLSPELRDVLKSHFGDQVDVDSETIQWKGGASHAAHERDTLNRRRDAQRVFSRSAGALGPDRLGDGGTEGDRGIQAENARVNAVEISAVAAGRKPLFHEQLGHLSETAARAVERSIQAELPIGAIARVDLRHGPELYVWHTDLVSRLTQPGPSLWQQIQQHSDDGRWLGYGVNWHEPGVRFQRVVIRDATGRVVAGFGAPPEHARLYGAARAQDWTDATGQAHTYRVITREGAE